MMLFNEMLRSVGSNKKRKLQDEKFGLPSPIKHKFREQSSEDPEVKLHSKCTIKGKTSLESTDEGSEVQHMESVTDSNSFDGESDSGSSLHPEDIYEVEFLNACNQHPSTSSSSCSCKNFTNTDCFLNRISINKIRNTVDRKMNHPVNLKVALLYEPGSRDPEMQQLSENNEIEQCSDVDLEDMMPDPNQVNPNSYVLSSGRWAINKDARLSNKKPTIDKEFEQYFSMLVL